jgi:hypothetical protein
MNLNGIISLLFACIEFLLLFNLLVFIKKSRFDNIALSMIALLASYQLLEFIMCQFNLTASFYPYIAFLTISFLPPLNLLLVFTLTGLKSKWINYLIFLPAVFFSIYYLFVIPEFDVVKCTVLYASYHYPLGDVYGALYYFPLLISLILLGKFIKKEEDKKKKNIANLLFWGGIFISLPVVVGFTLMFSGNYSVISAMESIMCKFAFVYAIILSFVCLYNSPFNDERNYFKYLFNNKQ